MEKYWAVPPTPMMVPPMWYDFSIAFSRMTTRFVSTLSKVLRQSFSAYYRFLDMHCLVSVNTLAEISNNLPTSGASIHSFVDSREYLERDMM